MLPGEGRGCPSLAGPERVLSDPAGTSFCLRARPMGDMWAKKKKESRFPLTVIRLYRTKYEQPRGGYLSPRSISERKRRNSCAAPLFRLRTEENTRELTPPPKRYALGPIPARSPARKPRLATDHPGRLPPLDARTAPRCLFRLLARFARRRVPEPGRHPFVPHSGPARMAKALCAETVQRGVGTPAHEVLRV